MKGIKPISKERLSTIDTDIRGNAMAEYTRMMVKKYLLADGTIESVKSRYAAEKKDGIESHTQLNLSGYGCGMFQFSSEKGFVTASFCFKKPRCRNISVKTDKWRIYDIKRGRVLYDNVDGLNNEITAFTVPIMAEVIAYYDLPTNDVIKCLQNDMYLKITRIPVK